MDNTHTTKRPSVFRKLARVLTCWRAYHAFKKRETRPDGPALLIIGIAKRDPEFLKVLTHFGSVFADRDAVRLAFERAHNLSPESHLVAEALLEIYGESGMIEPMMALCSALESNPAVSTTAIRRANYRHGFALQEQKEYGPSGEYFRKAVNQDAPDVATLISAGRAFILASRYVEAVDMLEQALAVNPDSEIALFSLGLCHAHLEQFELAADRYKHWLEVSPRVSEDMMLPIAETYEFAGRYDEAEALRSRAEAVVSAPEQKKQLVAVRGQELLSAQPELERAIERLRPRSRRLELVRLRIERARLQFSCYLLQIQLLLPGIYSPKRFSGVINKLEKPLEDVHRENCTFDAFMAKEWLDSIDDFLYSASDLNTHLTSKQQLIVIERGFSRYPNDAHIQLRYAELLLKHDQPARAVEVCPTKVPAESLFVEADPRFLRAQALEAIGRYRDAQRQYLDIIAVDARNSEAWEALAALSRSQGVEVDAEMAEKVRSCLH